MNKLYGIFLFYVLKKRILYNNQQNMYKKKVK